MSDLPTLYIDTSAWNVAKGARGRARLLSLFSAWQPVYSDAVLREILAIRQDGLRQELMDFMRDSDPMRVTEMASGAERTYRFERKDPHEIELHGSTATALDPLIAKFYGGRSADSFSEIMTGMKDEFEAMLKEALPPALAVQAMGQLNSKLRELSESMEKAHGDGIEFNGRSLFQDVFFLDSIQTNPNNIRPPHVIDQLWSAVEDRVWECCQKRVNKHQFFGAEGHEGVPSEFLNGLFERCLGMYSTLNFYGYAADRQLTEDDRIAGSLADARHVALATSCNGLLTSDRRLHYKAYAIYEFLGANTRSLWLKEDPDGCRVIEAW